MAEYLAPGVYVEEFDSGLKAMEGVGTSTAGFVGMAQKGPIKGLPVLITGMADYQRRFGGYLAEKTYGSMRYLPYAVEQFFANGGSTCYVMRVCSTDKETGAGTAQGSMGGDFLEVHAASPGQWGNTLQVRFIQNLKAKTPITKKLPAEAVTVATEKYAELEAEQKKLEEALKTLSEAKVKQQEAEDKAEAASEADKAEAAAAAEAAKQETEKAQAQADTQKKAVEEKAAAYTQAAAGIFYEVGDSKCLQEGDLVCVSSNAGNSSLRYTVVDKIEDKKVYIRWPVYDLPGNAMLYLVEWNLSIQDETTAEQYEAVSFNDGKSSYIGNTAAKSQLVTIKCRPEKLNSGILEKCLKTEEDTFFTISITGGTEGTISQVPDASLYTGKDGAPGERTGLTSFQTISDVSIMAIPGIVDKAVQSALVTHCESMGNRFAVLDMPEEDKEVAAMQAFRENIDSSYAAMYHPWLQCYDALANKSTYFPPSGAMAGIYGRTDNTRGVHKAPANEVVRNCTGLSVNYNEAEQGKLNPKGINLIRALPGQGIRVWGARTCSSDGNWKYVNVRRLFIYIEESIKTSTGWAVFEPNDEMLWSRVEGTIKVFLTTQWRNGALTGSSAEEAFFINIGRSTMTQDDILNGRLICIIGVAPVRPAEFVIFRITQKMETAQ